MPESIGWKHALGIGFTVSVLTLTTSAFAQDSNTVTLSSAVSYRDLDLTTDAGRTKLQHRVQRAALELCARSGQSFLPAMKQVCLEDAMARAAELQRHAIAEARAPTPSHVAVNANGP
jgi:UrcA family protein